MDIAAYAQRSVAHRRFIDFLLHSETAKYSWFMAVKPSHEYPPKHAVIKGFITYARTTAGRAFLERPPTHRIVAALTKRVRPGSDAAEVADAAIAIWHDFATELQSIIGRQGVVALFNRSIALTARTHPWLSSSRAPDDHSVDINGLQTAIAQQSSETAITGSGELLQTFYDLLQSLIGTCLCEQLLDAARDDSLQTDRETDNP